MISLNTLRSKSILHKIIPALFAVCLLANFYYHFSIADKVWFVDLRNRVVGARLMDMGISPYYFKWNPSYPETLYDPIDRCNIKNNMITSPPSVLLLMQPLGRLSYIQIGRIWVIIHYIFFSIIFIGFYRYFKEPLSRTFIAAAGIMLLFSGQWVNSIVAGQTHFFLPAFMAIMILLSGTGWKYRFLTIGGLMAILVWLRPNALILVPFIFLCQQVNRKQLAGGFTAGAALLMSITLLLHHLPLWQDFYHSCQEWTRNNINDFKYLVCEEHTNLIEGKLRYNNGLHIFHSDVEIFLTRTFMQKITGIAPSYRSLLLFACISYLAGLLFYLKKQAQFFPEALLTGLFFYWLFEIVAPIPKTTYYYVELFVAVYYLAGKFNQLHKIEQSMLLLALVFIFLDFVPTNMIIAEVLTMSSLGFYIIRSRRLKDKAHVVS